MRVAFAVCLSLAFSLGCSGAPPAPPVNAAELRAASISAVDLSASEFAPSVKRLLDNPKADISRLGLLTSAVRYQFKRAANYFAAGHEQAALRATYGALYLVRAGELRREMLRGAEPVLLAAAESVAHGGDEGLAEGFYGLAGRVAIGEARKEVELHLNALARWQLATREGGSMQAAGARTTTAVRRALVERTPENLNEAQKASVLWLSRALRFGGERSPPTTYFEHDERTEAQRAHLLGAMTVAALYLRDGDAASAAAALEVEPLARVANSKLVESLNAAAGGAAEAWAELFGVLEASGRSRGYALNPAVARGAAWGAAVELYRVEPNELRAAIPISTLLVEHGMGDVASLVIQSSLSEQPDPRALNWAMRLLFQALTSTEQMSDLALARQVFTNSQPLLELAESDQYLGRVRPSAAEFRYIMGAMESRAGHLGRALPHLEASVESNPSTGALRLLAAIHRQRGETGSALKSLKSIVALARSSGDQVTLAQAQLGVFEVAREASQNGAANTALKAALGAALRAREQSRTNVEVAVSERVLADVLERYGDIEGAARASDRAHDAGLNSLQQTTATLLDASRRSLTNGDLAAGRLALRRALEANLNEDDLVYAALWLQLLETRLKVPSDGSVAEALVRVETPATWAAALRDWGRGHASDEQLLARAQLPVERVEAEFYITLKAHFQAASNQTLAGLRSVAESEAIELIEVRIARDLVSAKDRVRPSLPEGVSLP